MSKTVHQKMHQVMKPKTEEFSFVKHYQRHFIKLSSYFLFLFKTFQQQFNLISTSTNEFALFI